MAAGAALLLALGINRVAFTPPPPIAANPRGPTAPSPEARSDLLGVAAAATSILHGLASADVVARETAVELGGVALPAQGVGPAFGPPAAAGGGGGGLGLATWAATAITTAIPSVVSVAAVVGGRLVFWAGLFPPAAASEAAAGAAAGGDARADGGGDDGGGSCGSGGGGVLGSPVGSDIVARAVASRTRAYLADTKSVPRADAEFRWLPRGTPAVVVVPFGGGYGGGGGGGAAGGGAAGGGCRGGRAGTRRVTHAAADGGGLRVAPGARGPAGGGRGVGGGGRGGRGEWVRRGTFVSGWVTEGGRVLRKMDATHGMRLRALLFSCSFLVRTGHGQGWGRGRGVPSPSPMVRYAV